jgi:hypothetical protein
MKSKLNLLLIGGMMLLNARADELTRPQHAFSVVARDSTGVAVQAQPTENFQNRQKTGEFDWIKTARVFLIDAYQPPFAPTLEYDAELLAATMEEMNANVVRFGTMGKYATIQGVRFSTHPDQGNRDLLAETIAACKPKGIKVVPYISTGHKLAWSMVTKDNPEYAHVASPNGLPNRLQMMIGEDHGTVCWMTPYKDAFMELVEHVVRDYDIDGMYFDTWRPFYFWEGAQTCYCEGCRNGFRLACGKEIPYHEHLEDYTKEELATIDQYHHWYYEEYIKIVQQACQLIKSIKNIPLIYNADNPDKIAGEDPRILHAMDAFLYERSKTMLERAEGVSLARALDLDVWPYVGVYNNWQRAIYETYSYQQQIFTNMMFGGGVIIAQPYAYTDHKENRRFVSYPFEIIKQHEKLLNSLTNYPYVGVVYYDKNPEAHARSSWWGGQTDTRTSTLGAFAACLFNHVQVSSIHEFILDQPDKLQKYAVLYLADIPHLSPSRIENIKEFVRNGGGLIVSYATSLYNADGKRCEKFGLEDLIGVVPVIPDGGLADDMRTYSAKIGGPSDLYLLKRSEVGGTMMEKWDSRLIPAWFYEPVKALNDENVIMDIVTGDGRHPLLPGVVLSQYGRGKVIYSACSLESLYLKDGKYILGELMADFIQMVSPVNAPYHFEAPSSVFTNLAINGDQWIFHITNWTGDKFERLYVDDNYLAPVENARLTFEIPQGKKLKSLSIFVKAPFKKKVTERTIELIFPRIEAYQAVQVDFADEKK